MVLAYLVYIILMAIMLLFTVPLSVTNIQRRDVIIVNKLSYFFPILVLGIVLGLRYGVGVDYYSYEQIYESQKWHSIFNSEANEYIFGAIFYICYSLGVPYACVQIILNVIFFLFIYKAFENKQFLFPWVIIFIFLTGFLFLCLNIQRQGIAFVILLYGIQFVEARKFTKFLITIVIACGFHFSAVLFLPIYFVWHFIEYIKFRKLQILFWLVSFLFSAIILQVIADMSIVLMEGTKYGRYGAAVFTLETDRGSGLGIIVKSISDLLIILYSQKLFKYYKRDDYFKIIYFIFFLGCLLSNIFQYNLLLSRVSFLFVSFRIVILGYFCHYMLNYGRRVDEYVALCLLFVYFIYFLGMIYLGNNDCSPFRFIFLQ